MVLRKDMAFNLLLLYGVMLLINQVESCNKTACESIVSKCLSTQNCKCEPKNCPCHSEFISCLGEEHYKECCSCIDLCPKPSNNIRNHLSKKSHVEEFNGIPELFNALITSKSKEFEWDIVTFEVDTAANDHTFENDVNYNFESNEENLYEIHKDRGDIVAVNCSVIYLSSCISWNKCRQSCQSTGASSYRWFHDGCCECVGSTCINYGLNESRCKNCPEFMDDEEDLEEIVDDDGTENNQFSNSSNAF